MRLIRTWLVAAAVALGCAGSANEAERPPDEGLNVLFIGNSLTYVNSLPAIVSALADSAGVTRLNYRMVAFPDYNLDDHWSQGESRRAIQTGGWHFVVLQQAPSSVLANRAQLIRSTKQFDTEIRRVSARSALYMVWPTIDRQQDFPGASLSYRLAADSVNGMLFPVGEAWRVVLSRDPSIALYSSDGLHPSPAGSYLAALVMFQQLYNRSPVGLPARLTLRLNGSPILQVSPQAASVMQTAALEANAQFGRR